MNSIITMLIELFIEIICKNIWYFNKNNNVGGNLPTAYNTILILNLDLGL